MTTSAPAPVTGLCRHCKKPIIRTAHGSGTRYIHKETEAWACLTLGAEPEPALTAGPANPDGWVPGCPDCRGHTPATG